MVQWQCRPQCRQHFQSPHQCSRRYRGWKFGKDFLWMSNSLPRKRHDLLIYTYPYTGQGSLGIDRMTEMRDSVLRENIQGAYEDSYPTTQRNILYTTVMSPCTTARCAESCAASGTCTARHAWAARS
nr:DUF4837 family protein [Porphyromonas macacae]